MNLPDLSSELTFKASRSSGPGGQHVNKTSSRIELIFSVQESQILNEDQKQLLFAKIPGKITDEGLIRVSSQTERSQTANKEIAIRRFHDLIQKALTVQKKRKLTKATKASKEKRLQGKKKLSEIKKLRSSRF